MGFARRLAAGGIVALLFACSVRSGGNGDYEREEDLTLVVVSCEEGFARLEECCPAFEAPENGCQDYTYQRTSTCGGSKYVDRGGTQPVLSLAESRCIRETSCSALVEREICRFYQQPLNPALDMQQTSACL